MADSKMGYLGVRLNTRCKTKPYQARVRRGGKLVSLGSFVTAEEAALCVARSPEGQVAAERAATAQPLTSEEARQQAQAEGLTLRVAENTTGYFGVHLSKPGQPKPYMAQVWRGGKTVSLGCFATAEEAALCVARSPEGQAAAAEAAERAAAAPPLTSEEVRRQAQAEGLTLRVADSSTGYSCVYLNQSSKPKPYAARVRRGGKEVYLGSFATAEEAALCVARSPEGQAAAEREASVSPMSEEENVPVPAGATLKEESAAPPMPLGAYVKEEEVPSMPPGAFFKEEEVVPPTPPGGVVKQEHGVVVVRGDGLLGGRPKRQRKN